MIGVKRKTGVAGILARLTIYINDQAVGKIKEKQHIQLPLPDETAQIHVAKFGLDSNTLTVQAGELVEINHSIWFYLNYLLAFLGFAVIIFFLPDNYQVTGYLTVLVLSTLLSSFTNSYTLKIIYP